jgi:hypothetical protein
LADAIFALEADNDDTPSALQIVSADLGLDASFNADNATILEPNPKVHRLCIFDRHHP